MHHVGTFLNEMIMGMPDTIEELFAYVLERLEIDMREYTTELYQNQLKMSTAERIMSKARGGVDPKRDLSVQGAAAKWKSKKHSVGETGSGANRSVTTGADTGGGGGGGGDTEGTVMAEYGKLDGAAIVRSAMTFLVCSRSGLLETELMDLLKPDNLEKLPSAVSSRLFHSLWLYLQRGDSSDQGSIRFTHRQLKEAVRLRYFRNDWKAESAVHAQLAAFLRNIADPQGDLTWRGCSHDGLNMPSSKIRAFSDLVWYQLRAYQLPDLQRTLCGLSFLEARCRIIAGQKAVGDAANHGNNGNSSGNNSGDNSDDDSGNDSGHDGEEDGERAGSVVGGDGAPNSGNGKKKKKKKKKKRKKKKKKASRSSKSHFGQLLNDYSQALSLLENASYGRLKASLKSAGVSRQELVRRISEFEVFIHSQHANIVAAPALLAQLALAQPDGSAPCARALRFLCLRPAGDPRVGSSGFTGGNVECVPETFLVPVMTEASARQFADSGGDGVHGAEWGRRLDGDTDGDASKQGDKHSAAALPVNAIDPTLVEKRQESFVSMDSMTMDSMAEEEEVEGDGGSKDGGIRGASLDKPKQQGSKLRSAKSATLQQHAPGRSVSGRAYLQNRYRQNVLPYVCQWVNKPSKNRIVAEYGPFASQVTACAVSRNGKFIAIGQRTGTIRLLCADTGATLRQLGSRHRGEQVCVAVIVSFTV